MAPEQVKSDAALVVAERNTVTDVQYYRIGPTVSQTKNERTELLGLLVHSALRKFHSLLSANSGH